MSGKTEKILAEDIMTREVITVSPGDDVEKAARLLLENNISGLPVITEDGRVAGMISEADIIFRQKKVDAPSYSVILGAVVYLKSPQRYIEELKRTVALTVEELMNKNLHTVGPEATVEEISTVMVEKGVNRVPVVDEKGRLLGIVTRQDIIRTVHGQRR